MNNIDVYKQGLSDGKRIKKEEILNMLNGTLSSPSLDYLNARQTLQILAATIATFND